MSYEDIESAKHFVKTGTYDKAIALALISIAEKLEYANLDVTVNVANQGTNAHDFDSWGN